MTQQPHRAAMRAAEVIRLEAIQASFQSKHLTDDETAEIIDRELGLSELEAALRWCEPWLELTLIDRELDHEKSDRLRQLIINVRAALA